MRNIILILLLLIVPFVVLAACGMPTPLSGRIAIVCVFFFTGLGHFVQARPMSAMVPTQFPEWSRLLIIYISGVIEWIAAAAILVSSWHRIAGIFLCVFLVLVLPANIGSAMRRVSFGGHAAGPSYLLARIPLQAVLIGWIYWFVVHDN